MSGYVEFKHVYKTYQTGDVKVEALKDVSFEIGQGEICVIVGQSGAGKTTLLNILGGMDTLSEGEVILDGNDVSKYNKKQLAAYRRQDIGFVFQFYNLIPNLTKPYLLAGGINCDNVTNIMDSVKTRGIKLPFCVDVSSSVETDGYKDEKKIRDIIHVVRKN